MFSNFSLLLSQETSAPKSQSACSQKTLPRCKCLPFSLLSVIFSILEVQFPAILREYQEEEGSGSSAQRGAVIKCPLISIMTAGKDFEMFLPWLFLYRKNRAFVNGLQTI